MARTNFRQPKQQGFALLMTLIVVTVLVAIGLTVLDVSTKQIRLSTNAKDSEVAFHAANAGMECARYWRRVSSSLMETGQSISPSCFSVAATDAHLASINPSDLSGDGEVYFYKYSFSWGTSPNNRCTRVSNLVMVADPEGTQTLTLQNIQNYIAGSPEPSGIKRCAPGEKCTVLAVRGSNKECTPTPGYGTVEREVLLQF